MNRRIVRPLLTIIGACSVAIAQNTPVIVITPGADQETRIVIDPQTHLNYGVTYPLTYEFSTPQGIAGLRAYKRYSTTINWIRVQEKTSGDFFNADEAVRFDQAAGKVFLSIGFADATDTLFVRIADSSGQPVPAAFSRICKYYDDRSAVVSCSADDYADWNRANFLTTIHNFRSKHLWLSVAANTGACTQSSFDSLQVELDRGYVEAAAHSRTHPQGPFMDPNSEVTGCITDLIYHLIMPPLFSSGDRQYVYSWVAPYGYDDAGIHTLLGQSHVLANRQYYIQQGSAELPAWDSQNRLYSPFGVTREVGPVMSGFMGNGDSVDLNNAFDQTVSRGGIYFLMCHPSIVEWNKAYTWSHLNHVSDRTNLWYVGLGHLFLYHFMQERYQYIPTSVADNTPSAPSGFALEQNYPNPFNPVTTIKYTIGVASGEWQVARDEGRGAGEAGAGGSGLGSRNTRLVVYDLLGKELAVLVDEKKAPGSYEVTFDGSRLASGVYFYRLAAGSFAQTRKLTLLK